MRAGALLLLVAVGTGCGTGGDGGTGTATAGGTAAAPLPLAPMGDASITGVVKFTGTPPDDPPSGVLGFAGCLPAGAGSSKHVPRLLAPGGNLQNAFVYVKDGLPPGRYDPPATPVVVDQSTCEFLPHVFGVMVGQKILMANSDTLTHNVSTREFNLSFPSSGVRIERAFHTPAVMTELKCDIHGWMRAWAGVLPHPYFAVTGADGAFALKGLVPGTYTVAVWHETMPPQEQKVTVVAGESKAVAFTFKL